MLPNVEISCHCIRIDTKSMDRYRIMIFSQLPISSLSVHLSIYLSNYLSIYPDVYGVLILPYLTLSSNLSIYALRITSAVGCAALQPPRGRFKRCPCTGQGKCGGFMLVLIESYMKRLGVHINQPIY
jgi:hypothetical protein